LFGNPVIAENIFPLAHNHNWETSVQYSSSFKEAMRGKPVAVPNSAAYIPSFALEVQIFVFSAVKRWSPTEPL
jgi:hypothetical protein